MEIVVTTCTFCGCVCDDIELHAEGHKIVKRQERLQPWRRTFQIPHRGAALPDALTTASPRPWPRRPKWRPTFSQRQHAACLRSATSVRDDPQRRGLAEMIEAWSTATPRFDTALLK